MKDITERQKFEVEFKNNTKLWQITLDAISESIFLIDLNHKILQCNRATLNILGKSNYKEIIGHSCWELVHGTSEPVEWCPVKRMRESGQREIAIEKVNGRWAEISATPVFDDKGDLTGTVHVITDITSRKRIEDASRESEQQYRMILNSLNDPMHVVDKDLKIIFQNPAMAKWLDKLNVDSDLIGKNIYEKFPFLDYDKIYNEYSKIFRTGETLVTREINELFNRKVFTETLKIPIKSEGKVEQVITIMRDITEQKEAEQKLKESEKKYRYLIENALEGVWVIDSKADTILVNPSMANILGYSVEEMIGKSIFSFMDENEVKITKLNLEKRKKGLSEERDAQFTHRRGNKVYLRIRATPIFDSEGNYEGTYAFLADITQKMLAEQKLKESEERFRTLFEIAPASISVLDLDGNIILSNQQFCNLHGVKNPELLKGRKILEFIAEKDWSKLKEAMKKSLEGLPRGLNQYTMLKDNGTEFPAEAISSGIKNKKGEIIGLIGVAQDITERNIAEQKLKESEEKYSHLFLSSPYSIIIANMNGKVIDCNFLEDKITGYLKKEIIGKNMLDIPMFPKEYLPVVIKDFKTLLKGRIPKPNEVQIRKKNGILVWVQPTASIFKIEGESYIQIIMQEISERKISEEMLKESEENFRTIAEQAFMGTLIIQNDQVAYMNNALLQIFDFSQGENNNWKKDDLIKLIHPEDLQYLRKYRQRIRDGESDIKPYYSYRVFTKYGKIKWIDQFSRPIIYRGKPAELVTIMDITEKKKAEQELVKLNSLKSELLRRTSHELKTPLVSIKGFSDLLLTVHKEKLDDYVLATIHEIRLGCERLESLIQDILRTSELESESVELKKSEEDLSFLIKLCVKELQGLIRLRNHE
ncbi:MAG: PAS domain S-box protein, partial [Candidatus Lokiarchaeota archaeon]|nr:PAS domain S-box protein [Candidatus Lokiarchaeota archaeon]